MENKKYKPISQYKDSGMLDDNGVPILEGSVIIGDGYGKDSFYCVVFEDGVFGRSYFYLQLLFVTIIFYDKNKVL